MNNLDPRRLKREGDISNLTRGYSLRHKINIDRENPVKNISQ